jgi:hypothetical protein
LWAVALCNILTVCQRFGGTTQRTTIYNSHPSVNLKHYKYEAHYERINEEELLVFSKTTVISRLFSKTLTLRICKIIIIPVLFMDVFNVVS